MSLRTLQPREPWLLEYNRAGRLIKAGTSIATNGRAPIQDVPTTTANWMLQNPASSQRTLVLLRAGLWLSGGTSDKGASLIAGVTPSVPATPVTANATGHTTGSLRGLPLSGDGPFLGVNVTVPTMAAHFVVLGGVQNTADATIGSGAVFDLDGALLIEPGYGLAVDVLSGLGTNAKWAIYLLLASLDLDLEGG